MELTDLQRIKKVVKWLIFSDYGENEKEIAELLGYKKSSFSQIMNGKVPISDKFIDKITSVDDNINKVWIKSGKGEMLKQPQGYTNTDKPPQQVAEPQAVYQPSNTSYLQEQISFLKREIEYLQRENQLLQENKTLLERENKRLQEQESNYIEELKNTISRLEQENHTIKSKPQNRATG
ncbi:hypothetical protein JZ949_05010 [Riemerella anatipestifer]